ncbi:MAG TPA: four-carbon acid sugar kinase family protein [bacterium]|nr:four-carbon acid sugar kinase family protein [bacterium]
MRGAAHANEGALPIPASSVRPIFILADDLTGAADAAHYFRSERCRVRVTFDGAAPWAPSLGAGTVQVHDSETRAVPASAARDRIIGAVAALLNRPGPAPRVFKKVDSTLRGPLGVELEATLRTLRWPLALLAPALPVHRRTVRGGRVAVDGVPVTATVFARDPRAPVRSDRIAEVLRETTALPTHEIDLATVRAGPARLCEVLRGIPPDPGIAVVDA